MNKQLTKNPSTATPVRLNETIYKLFKGVLPSKDVLPFDLVNKETVKYGYLVAPEVCTSEVLGFLRKQKIDYNSTFYKKWSTVISKSRFELLIDQLKHYASTYGTNHTGTPYIPEVAEDVPAFNTFKVIKAISKEEVISRCEKMLFSGIALSQETIQDVLGILSAFNHKIDVEKVKNKEAKMFLHKETRTVPADAVEMVRYLVYLATEKTLLIKDKTTLALIKNGSHKVELAMLANKFGMDKLSSVYFRFKEIFLALKEKPTNARVVNRLRKLADKHHKPMKPGYFENLLSNVKNINQLTLEKLDQISNYKKVLLLQTINIRMKELKNKFYLVRNQKLFVDAEAGSKPVNYEALTKAFILIRQSLINSLAQKATTIALPKGVSLTLPTSEKSFCGNYPLGTSFDLTGHDTIVGIHWRGEEGASDLDLKMHSINGELYGWNASYRNSDNSLVFSGDMTSANPEATELFYASRGFKSAGIMKVNLFRGAKNSKFRFFIAKEKITNLSRGYMVNPNNILATIESEMDSSEKTIGVITGNEFILAQFRTGKGRVSRSSVTDLYTDYALRTLDCYIHLESLLVEAGFTITDEEPAIDLRELSKDSLINLLS